MAAWTAVAERIAGHAWVEHGALPGRTNHLRAGVAVPLRWVEGRLEVITTLRAGHLRRHAGEVSFPGGAPDPGDADLAATAWRECAEEVGARPVRTLGRLSSMPVYTSDWRLEPFVVELAPSAPLVRCDEEVARILIFDATAAVASGEIETLAVGGADGRPIGMELPVFRIDGWLMYGATALALAELLAVIAPAFGRPPPRWTCGDLDWRTVMARGGAALQPEAPPR